MPDRKLIDVDESTELLDTDKVIVNASNAVGQITLTNIVNIIKNKIGSLKNPNKLTFTGAVKGDYDGSKQIEIKIPEGIKDYNDLLNKPQIGGIELTGNKTLDDLGIQPKIADIKETEIEIKKTIVSPKVVVKEEVRASKVVAETVEAKNLNTKEEFNALKETITEHEELLGVKRIKPIQFTKADFANGMIQLGTGIVATDYWIVSPILPIHVGDIVKITPNSLSCNFVICDQADLVKATAIFQKNSIVSSYEYTSKYNGYFFIMCKNPEGQKVTPDSYDCEITYGKDEVTTILDNCGGRNWARNTATPFVKDTEFGGTNNKTPFTNVYVPQGAKAGDWVTISFDYEATDIVAEAGKEPTWQIDGEGNVNGWGESRYPHNGNLPINQSGHWSYSIQLLQKAVENKYWKCGIRCDNIASGHIKIWNYKLERGKIKTDWTEAPEDVYQKHNDDISKLMITNKASGASITLSDSAEFPIRELKTIGKTTQNGTPNPDTPIELVGVNKITITDSAEKEIVVTLPYSLKSIGDYKDELIVHSDGSGEFIKNIETYIENGTYQWGQWSSTKKYGVLRAMDGLKYGNANMMYAMSNRFIRNNKPWNGIQTYCAILTNSTVAIVAFNRDVTPAEAQKLFQQWYNEGNPLVIDYVLETPKVIPLTKEEVEQLLFNTFYPTSNISNNQGTNMEITYVCDPKNYIDNKISTLTALTLEK